MIEVSAIRRIDAPPAQIWRTLAAFDQLALWAPPIEHSSYLTQQRTGPGAKRRVQLGRTTLVETVTEWDPDNTLAYDIEGLPPFLPAVGNRWTLEPTNGGTTVTLATTIDASGPVLSAIVSRPFKRTADALVDGLKAYLESTT